MAGYGCSVDQHGSPSPGILLDTNEGTGGGVDVGFSFPDGGTLPDVEEDLIAPPDSSRDQPVEDMTRDRGSEDSSVEDNGSSDGGEEDTLDAAVEDLADTTADVIALPCDTLLCGDLEECEETDAGPLCVCLGGFHREGDDCVADGPEWFVVIPAEIDFGRIGLNVSTYKALTIRNTDTDPHNVFQVNLRSEPSSGFRVFSPVSFPVEVAAGESLVVEVRFRPTTLRYDRETQYGNAVEVHTDDHISATKEVPLRGTAITDDPVYCLNWEWSVMSFGDIQPDDSEERELELRNCGTADLSLVRLGLVEDTAPSGLSVTWDHREILLADTALVVTVAYEPSDWTPLSAWLEAESADGSLARVLFTSELQCPTAEITLESDHETDGDTIFVGTGTAIEFDGGASDDPAAGDLDYIWEVGASDTGDVPTIEPDLESDWLTLTPTVPGYYSITLRVHSRLTGIDSCNEDKWTIVAHPGDPQVDIVLTWNNWANLDLHVIRSNADGTFGDWGRDEAFQPEDAYWDNLTPDWGVSGDLTDNPWFFGDDTNGWGPEHTVIPTLEADRSYRVGVNYADRNYTPQVTPNLEISIDDTNWAGSATLTETGFWVPVTITGAGEIVPE